MKLRFVSIFCLALITVNVMSEDKPRLDKIQGISLKIGECWKEARPKCEPLEDSFCLGVKLPYTHTSLALSNLTSQRAARESLEQLTVLKNLPHCWSVVQPFLCAILFPECHNSSVQLPSQEMCAITRGPCRLLELEKGWPEYLKCKDEFPPKCKTATRDLPFNTTGQCLPPLVNTSNEHQWYEGVRGCGVQCLDPLFTAEEHKDLQSFIAVLGGLCLGCSAFTVLTYLIDWRSASKYPALIIFYINGCFLVASIGFMVQFHSDVRGRVTCYSDGTLRTSEPSTGSDLSCVVVFVCLYYFMIAAGMWFIILGYAWYRSFKSLAAGHCQQNLDRKASYFHLISWSIPLVFTIGIIASAEVEADSAAGVCFLSPTLPVRVGALLVPVIFIIFGGVIFLLGGLNTLVKMKLEFSTIISDHANKKIVETIIRLGIFIVTLVIFLIITIYCHVDVFLHQDEWKESLRKYILCVSGISNIGSRCLMGKRPSVNLYKLHLMALFGSGIIMASWCWTKNSVEAWQRFLRRVVGVGSDEPVRLSKHKVIAQAFAKRHDLNTAGRLSISLRSLHSDPLGLNFEMNSATSGDVSSGWAAVIPYLMHRRGAVSGSSAFIFRRNSVNSEYSISRRVSMESNLNNIRRARRHSLDSQMSFHVSDVERFAALQTAVRFGGRHRRKKEWFSLRRGRHGSSSDRRNSNTSDDSNMGSMILPALTVSNNDSLFTTMMKRLSLSGDENSLSARRNSVFHAATDSEDDNNGREDTANMAVVNAILRSAEFSRKFNGFKKKGGPVKNGFIKHDKGKVACANEPSSRVFRASVGIQTSLESLNGNVVHMPTRDKSCQVSTPLLRAAMEKHILVAPSGSMSSLSESSKHGGISAHRSVAETSFNNGSNKTRYHSRRSLSPLSKSLRKFSQSGKIDYHIHRSLSENEKIHCVLSLEEHP